MLFFIGCCVKFYPDTIVPFSDWLLSSTSLFLIGWCVAGSTAELQARRAWFSRESGAAREIAYIKYIINSFSAWEIQCVTGVWDKRLKRVTVMLNAWHTIKKIFHTDSTFRGATRGSKLVVAGALAPPGPRLEPPLLTHTHFLSLSRSKNMTAKGCISDGGVTSLNITSDIPLGHAPLSPQSIISNHAHPVCRMMHLKQHQVTARNASHWKEHSEGMVSIIYA